MSTEKLAEIQEDFLTCEICLCPFSSDSCSPKAPKILSCLHTFCREDLSKAISPGDEQVECFVCRIPTELDRVKGVDSIKTNFMLQKLIAACQGTSEDGEGQNATNKSSQVSQGGGNTKNKNIDYNNDGCSASVCGHCTDDVERPVVWCCSQCSEEYCLSCGELHTKAKKFREHVLNTATVSKWRQNMGKKCSVHKSEEIKFVCETCGPAVMCCSVCVYDGGHHENRHKVLSVQSAASRHKDRLVPLRDKAEEFYKEELKVLEDIADRMAVNQATLQSTVGRINGTFSRLREIIDEKETAWVAEVESQAADTARILAADRKAVSLQLANAELFIDTARQLMESYSDLELLDHHKKVEGNLCDALKVLSAPYELTGVATEPPRDIDETLIVSFQNIIHKNNYQLAVNKIKRARRRLVSSNEDTQVYFDTVTNVIKEDHRFAKDEALVNFKIMQALQGHTDAVVSVSFNHDGSKIVSGSFDNSAKVWDTVTGAVLQTLEGHRDAVTSVAFSHDDSKIVSGSCDSTVKVWDTVTGAVLQTLEGHRQTINSVAFNHDGSKIVSGSFDNSVKVWDQKSKEEVKRNALELEKLHTKLEADALIREHLLGKSTQNFHGNLKKAPEFTMTEVEMHSTLKDRWIVIHDKVYDVTSFLSKHPGGEEMLLEKINGSSDLTSYFEDIGHSSDARAMMKKFYIGDLKKASEYTLSRGVVLDTLQGHTERIQTVAFNHDGTKIVSGSDDNTVKMWDTVTGAVLQTLEGHSDRIQTVAFNHDGSKIVSGSFDNSAKVWDTATGAVLPTLEGHTNVITSVAFSHDDSKIVSGSFDHTVKVWDTVTGAVLQTLEGHRDDVTSVAFNHDGSKIVSGSCDHTVKVWDSTSAAPLTGAN